MFRAFPPLAAVALLGAAPLSPPQTPGDVIAAAPARDWAAIPPDNLVVIGLEGGGRVTIALAPAFAPRHVANIRALARAHWFDGTAIVRVQDNYVVQWGDPSEAKPLSATVVTPVPAEYDRSATGLPLRAIPYRDSFAGSVGLSGPFPMAQERGRAWITHCYGIVGVGRNMTPDTGTGAELYAVIGHAPRALDRNVAVVGRVVDGFERMTALPRGTADLGFYADPKQRTPIGWVRLASDLPVTEQPRVTYLRPDSASFAHWLQVRANRRDSFFLRPAGAVDLCNALPPVKVSVG